MGLQTSYYGNKRDDGSNTTYCNDDAWLGDKYELLNELCYMNTDLMAI